MMGSCMDMQAGWKNIRIGVLMGGASSEREISLRSGHAVLEALLSKGLNAFAVELSNHPYDWSEQIIAAKLEQAFIALHGTYGEDGCIQGLLEILRIPYTGSGVLASSICMHKGLTKSLLAQHHLPTPVDVPLEHGVPVSFPVFVKPVAEGSSVGLHLVADVAQWHALGLQDTSMWLIESCVLGKEIAVSVLNGKALDLVEITPKSGLYDFDSKYTAGATEYHCPARLSDALTMRCQHLAERAVEALGCIGAPRVDLIVPESGEPVILEVNTIPGMTVTSLLPKAAAREGLSFADLCIAILQGVSLAYKPHRRSGEEK